MHASMRWAPHAHDRRLAGLLLGLPGAGDCNVFQRASIAFHQVTGVLEDDPECWREIDAWVETARVAAGMASNRLGLMGHYYGGMLDIYTDVTLQCATFGTHVEILEVDELSARRREVTPAKSRRGRGSSPRFSTCNRIVRA